MSTYTDLHNKIKENITVGYSPDDRITTQQVRFYNTKNEYWGTFRGDFAAENVDVNGGTLKNLTIVDSTLSNVSWPGGVNFDEFGAHLHSLSSQVISILDQKLPDVHRELDTEALTRLNEDKTLHELISTTDVRLSSFTNIVKQELKNDLSTAVHNLTDQDRAISVALVHQDRAISTYLNNVSVELDGKISDEATARIANDQYLSAEHDQLRSDFGEEIRDRTSEDIKLFNKISTEIADRIQADSQLSDEINQLHQSTALSLDTMDADHKAKLEHNRHYVIKYQLGGDGTIPKEYPYTLDDYAVNIFETANIAGRAYWKNKDGQRIEVGRVVQPNPESPTAPLPIDFLPLTDIKSNALLSAFDPYLTFSFNENVSTHRSGDNRSYVITFNQSRYSINSQLSDCYFDLEPISEQYHQVFIDGYSEKAVGYVKAARPVGEASNIVSGLITFDTAGSTEFDAFKLYSNVEFNTDDLSANTRPNNTKVTYLGNNRFKIEKNITSRNYIPLRNIFAGEEPLPEPFGSIYQYDGAGHPTVISEDGQLKSVLVNLASPYDAQTYKLEKNDLGEYSVLIAEGENGNKENVYLSATAAGLNTHFSIVSFSKQYRYNLYGLDEDGVKQKLTGCYIVPGIYNKTFVEAGEDCETIKVYIADLLWLNVFKNKSPFTLEKAEDHIWTYECTDAAGESVLNIKYNGLTRKLRFKITTLNGGQVVAQSYDIDVTEAEAINTEPFVRCATKELDLSRFDDLIYVSDSYTAIIDEHVRGNTDPSYRFSIDTSNLNTIKLKVPEKTSDDISREFIVAVEYKSIESDKTFRKFELVDKYGNPVELVNTTYGEPYLYVLPNKLAVYQVKEVYAGKFVAVDLNDEEDNYQIEQLQRKDIALSAEIDALSATLSADIDSLSARLSTEVDDLSTSLSTDIDSLSVRLSTEIDALSDSLSTTVELSVETLEGKLSAANERIDDISADVKGHLNYKGEIRGYVKDSEGHIREVTSVADMFANASYDNGSDRPYGTDVNVVLKNGFVYQVVSSENDYNLERFTITEGASSYSFEVGDYVIINCRRNGVDSKKISELTLNDLDVIDAVDRQDIAFLSAEVSSLSTDLSTTIDALSGETMTISSDVNTLSGHYRTTLSTDIGLSYTYPVGAGTQTQTLSVDQLLIVDEVTFQRYRLTIRNGALNINKVDSLNEA